MNLCFTCDSLQITTQTVFFLFLTQTEWKTENNGFIKVGGGVFVATFMIR